jgi:hypothetical protein
MFGLLAPLDIDLHQRVVAAHPLGRRNHGNVTYRLCVAAREVSYRL